MFIASNIIINYINIIYYNITLRAMRFELILQWLKVTYFTIKLSSLFTEKNIS